MANSFADTPEDKGVFLVDDDWHVSFIAIKSPKFISYILNGNTIDQILRDVVRDRNYYRFIVTEDGLDIPKLPSNVVLKWDIENSPALYTSTEDHVLSLTDDINEFIEKSNTALDKTLLKNMSKEIMETI